MDKERRGFGPGQELPEQEKAYLEKLDEHMAICNSDAPSEEKLAAKEYLKERLAEALLIIRVLEEAHERDGAQNLHEIARQRKIRDRIMAALQAATKKSNL